jgi:O-antigen/teichoic acid export membrane protein
VTHPRAATVLGARVSRHTTAYGLGSVGVVAMGLVTLAVLTRFLDLRSFGELAVLFFFAALLTVVFNLCTLQGSFMWVFGSTGEDDAGEPGDEAVVRDKRRALGTGLIVTTLVALVGTLVVVGFARSVADVLLPGVRVEGGVVWAAASGGLGAVWRFTSQTLRFERRPAAYVVLNLARPVFVLAVTIPLVVTGYGVEGALAGTALGTALATMISLFVTRRSYAVALDGVDVRAILRRGSLFVPIVAAFWVVQNADLYLVSRAASAEEVSLYRVASRIAAVLSYASSAFFMAWTPLQRTSAFAAVEREEGRPAIGAEMVTYFLFTSLWLLLFLAAFAELLVRIAPSSYAAAAPLIPAVGVGFVVHGLLIAMYRSSRFPHKKVVYVALATISAVAFVVVTPSLIAHFGLYGAPAGQVLVFFLAFLVLVVLSQQVGEPLSFRYRRIGGTVLVASACLGGIHEAGRLPAPWDVLVAGAVSLLFPLLAWTIRIIPHSHFPQILAIARSLPRHRASARDRVALRFAELGPVDKNQLELLVRERATACELAELLGRQEPVILHRFVTSLRGLGQVGAPSEHDAAIGAYLLSPAPQAERDTRARGLWKEGVEPLELHSLEATYQRLRQLPPRAWASARSVSDPAPTKDARH